MTLRLFALSILVAILVACNPDTPSPTVAPSPEVTLTPSPTSVPLTATPTLTPTATGTPSPTPTQTPLPVRYGPEDFPEDVNPLTGLAVEDTSVLERHPVALKVNIFPRGSNRPPWGLSLADIVYDYYHNDGYTRLYAIFYGNDAELVGPIRSGRLPDHELTRMYQSIFAYGSADQLINRRMLNSEYSNRVVLEGQRATCPPTETTPLCRYDPSGYDFLLGGTQALSEYITSKGVENGRQNLDGMSFYGAPPDDGQPAVQAYIRYSGDDYIRWEYDPDIESYLRFQDNVFDQGQGEGYSPLTDRLNDQQVEAENVVFIFARHEYFQQPPNEIVEIILSGSGKAYALRDGQIYEVDWNRPTTNSVLFLTFADGSHYPFKPGNTWFQVVGETSRVSQPEENGWRFEFRFP